MLFIYKVFLSQKKNFQLLLETKKTKIKPAKNLGENIIERNYANAPNLTMMYEQPLFSELVIYLEKK